MWWKLEGGVISRVDLTPPLPAAPTANGPAISSSVKNALPSCGQDVARGLRLHDRGDSAEEFRGDAGRGGDQARQEAPEPGEQEAAVVADGAEDGVNCVAVRAVEVVSFKQAVGLHVTEHGLDGVPAAHLAADGRGRGCLGCGRPRAMAENG